MSRKGKIEIEEKIKIVCECLEGELSQTQAAKIVGVHHETIREWIARYQAEGSLGLSNIEQHNRVYSKELKLRAVEAYLSGEGSILEICKKYQIRSKRQLRDWIKVYNSGKDFNKHKMSGGSRMKKTRKTTQEEQVSYQQVYTWVKKFSELGEAGLEDRRGQRTAQQKPRTEEEELRIKVAQLEHELYMTRMERDLLKKLEEVERRDAYRK